MIGLSRGVLDVLHNLNTAVNMNDHRGDLDMMTETNWRNEVRRRGRRSREVVEENTARGLGAEIALQSTGLFKSSCPITENAEGLTFAQRKSDMTCEDFACEVKTMSSRYNRWYLSPSQKRSVDLGARFNDVFVVLGVDRMTALVYRYVPRFVVDARHISRYIISNTEGYSEYRFDHRTAVANHDCVDLETWSA